MKTAPNKVIQQITDLASQNPDVAVLWLYGSQATGTARDDSDYDLAVAFYGNSSPPFDRLIRPQSLAIDWQSALSLPDEMLSIVDINQCPIPLALNIIESNHPLLIKDELRYIREQNRIWGLWSDILQRNKYLDDTQP